VGEVGMAALGAAAGAVALFIGLLLVGSLIVPGRRVKPNRW